MPLLSKQCRLLMKKLLPASQWSLMELIAKISQSTTFIKTKTVKIVEELSNLKNYLLKNKSIINVPEFFHPIFNRQKKILLSTLPAALLIIIWIAILFSNQINDHKQTVLDRGLMVMKLFPEKEASNWLARGMSNQHGWQVESLFKLKGIVLKMLENHEINYALIVNDRNRKIEAHTVLTLVGTKYEPVDGEVIFREKGDFIAQRYRDSRKKSQIDFSYPIYYGKKKLKIGTLCFGISFAEVERAIKARGIFLPLLSLLVLITAIGSAAVKDRLEIKEGAELSGLKGDRIGPYILEKKIASGGMGEIFIARKEVENFRMRAAIKRILPERASDKEFITSLLDEANLASQLHHPNIVTIHDFGNAFGTYYIAMEYIHGKNLTDIMQGYKHKMPIAYSLYILAEICKGLDYAHNKRDDFSKKPLNIVHRDISPQNILVSFEGEVKIVDFGIAKAAQRKAKNTIIGVVKGKLLYMSPEQAAGKGDIDNRSDIFSLGLLFYELLSGKKANQGETLQEILTFACQPKITPIGKLIKDFPAPLDQMVMKALQLDPADRYQTAGELLKDIIKFLGEHPGLKCDKKATAKFMLECFLNKSQNNA